MENNESPKIGDEKKFEKPVEVHHSHYHKKSLGEKLMKNPWMTSSIFLGVVVLILMINMFAGGMTGGVVGVSEDVAAQKVLDFVNGQTGGGVTLVEVKENSGLYEVFVEYRGDKIPLYITKDGENLIQGITPLSSFEEQKEPAPTEVTKSDKPTVELFIMTHCPYGTQAEKGFIPVLEALGNKIDASVNFVHYFMHEPEETETPRQVCIREEQEDKFIPYLECFLEDGDSLRCLSEVGVNQADLDECVENNAENYYAVDSGLSEEYGVQGSPSLVINGVIVSSGRSPSAFLETICGAFSDAPEECSLELDTSNPSPGFGYAEGSDTQAQC